MAFNQFEICSAALVKLGAAPIVSFSDPRPEADIASRLYQITRDMLLSSYTWSFTYTQSALLQSQLSPLADYQYSFNLPSDMLRCLSAGRAGRGRGIDYRISSGCLHANLADVVLTYQRRVTEDLLPPYFISCLVARLAAEFCIPVTENSQRAEALHRLAAAEMQVARIIDSQQSTPRIIDSSSLIDARLA